MIKLKNIALGVLAVAIGSWSLFSCADNSKVIEDQYDVVSSLEAWIKANKGEAYLNETKVADGLYMKIFHNVDQSSNYNDKLPNDSSFVSINYQTTYLDGKIAINTYESEAIRIGGFSWRTRYIPFMFRLDRHASYAGLTRGHYEALKRMHVGDSVVMYLAPNYGYYYGLSFENIFVGYRGDLAIAARPICVTMKFEDFKSAKELKNQADENLYDYQTVNKLSYVETGVYMKWVTKNDNVADSVRRDSTITLNYTGRFIGTAKYPDFVFDTNIEKVARDYNIYSISSSSTTNPYVSYSYDFKRDDTSAYGGLIRPFKSVINKMKLGDKVQFITTPEKAYGESGSYNTSGTIIYPYTPLIFEFEIVKKEEDTE